MGKIPANKPPETLQPSNDCGCGKCPTATVPKPTCE